MAVKPKKMKLTWWMLRGAAFEPVIHAVRDDRDVAMCGGKKTDSSVQVTGPKTIERHKKCIRCEAQLDRHALMQRAS